LSPSCRAAMAGMVSTQIKDTLKFPNCVAMAALPFCRLVLVWVDCVYHLQEFAPSSDGAPVNATAAHGAATFFAPRFGTDITLPQEAAPSHQTCSNPQAGP
jgi:hypothetical protein